MPAGNLYLEPIWYPKEENDTATMAIAGAAVLAAVIAAGAFVYWRRH